MRRERLIFTRKLKIFVVATTAQLRPLLGISYYHIVYHPLQRLVGTVGSLLRRHAEQFVLLGNFLSKWTLVRLQVSEFRNSV